MKLLTCETWVTKPEWYAYAKQHPEHVPFLLADRSPCMDPFLDPYTPSEQERRPLISGLCRTLTNFQENDIFIYLTKVDRLLYSELKILNKATSYLGIAALTVTRVYESHEKAAETFKRRRYVVDPASTLYPPNLAHDPAMPAATGQKSCIVWLDQDTPLTPDHFDEDMWRKHVKDYHKRQVKEQLCAAECRLLQVGGSYALQLDPLRAPVFTAADWGEKQMYQAGKILKDTKKIAWFCHQIACGRAVTDPGG